MATYETMAAPGAARRQRATRRLQVAHALEQALGGALGSHLRPPLDGGQHHFPPGGAPSGVPGSAGRPQGPGHLQPPPPGDAAAQGMRTGAGQPVLPKGAGNSAYQGPGGGAGQPVIPKGGIDPAFPANVAAFGQKYRSVAGRSGSDQQHQQMLGETLKQLPPRLRQIYLQGQAQLAFSGKHDQAFINKWIAEHSPFIPKGPVKKTFPGHRKSMRAQAIRSFG